MKATVLIQAAAVAAFAFTTFAASASSTSGQEVQKLPRVVVAGKAAQVTLLPRVVVTGHAAREFALLTRVTPAVHHA